MKIKVVLLFISLVFVIALWPMWWVEEPEAIEISYSPETNYGLFEIVCSCDNNIVGTYIEPHYYFTCADCGRVFTNTDANNTQEYYDLVEFEL